MGASSGGVVPPGIGHAPGLQDHAAAQRSHHIRQLRSIALHQGIDGVNAYKVRHPGAASIRIHSAPIAYSRKPAGYTEAVVRLVESWFGSDAALGQSNRADVARLNERLGTGLNPDNAFSKPLSHHLLRKLAELFADRGARLDIRQTNTLSKVRKAVKAARLQGGIGAVPFAPQAVRSGSDLLLGEASFRIELYRGRECIRVTADGTTQRIYLSTISALLAGMRNEIAPAVVSNPLPQRGIGELVSSPPEWAKAAQSDAADANSPGELATGNGPPLSDRIRKLAASRQPSEPAAHTAGTDPLAII